MASVRLACMTSRRLVFTFHSPNNPEGMSIDMVYALLSLIYLTSDMKPPWRGSRNPAPKRPCHLGKINLVHTDKAVALLFAVMRQLVVYIKQKHLHPLVTLLYKHSGHCQRIATVIARTGYDHYALRGQKARNNLTTHRTGGTFHKLYGIYFLRLTRSAVYILDYIRVKYFHQKQVLKGCLTLSVRTKGNTYQITKLH